MFMISYNISRVQDNSFIQRNDPQLQVQTEAELSLDEIQEREAAIRQLEVRTELVSYLNRGSSDELKKITHLK